MERPQRAQERQRKMTVYFDKRAEEQRLEEEKQEQKDKEQKELGLKVVAGVVSAIVNPILVMLLWNWLAPVLFGLATISYLQALGLYAIFRILFGNR